MLCSACDHENPTVAKFCQECGARLKCACLGCGTELPPQAKFCHECGQRTEPALETPAALPELARDREASVGPSPRMPQKLSQGRYEILREIGEGSKKRVYLAYDSRLDREVALAVIKADGLDETGRARVNREAQAMGRLGDHANIVTVHDIGEEDTQLFIVSQYMQGGDLEAHMQRAGDSRRLLPEEAIRIARQVCLALEHAHSLGVVHRDVKPGNIWIASDKSVRLGDFGLAVSLERSRLTQEGMMVGTVAYMAPEQALGRAPDARSDLYAVGATLYEMMTGRPPFLGDDAVAIISQHIHTQPVAPRWHSPDVPERLESLILDLLAKDPDKRPTSAGEVLERLDRSETDSAIAASPQEEPAINPLDRLASGIFVGREDPLERLRRGLDDAWSGRAGVLMLVGEPGIGKTRTCEEIATYASMRGAQVLWGRCYEGEGAPAYWPWMQIIRSYVHDCEPTTLMSEMGTGAAEIAEVVSDVRERLPGLPSPPKLDAEQARFRLFDSISQFLRNASQQSPIVLVLDDLHWADRPSLLLLQFLARETEGCRLLILATYRDVEVGRQHPLERTLADLARTGHSDRVLLRGLADSDVARFLELSSGRTPPPALVEAVFRETEGNPFFVNEVVRLLQSDGRLDQPETVESWSVEIPQGVRQVVGRRLDSLSKACNTVLTVGAVIGREFDMRTLGPVTDLASEELLEHLEAAEDARIISEVEDQPGIYRFSHALVRETLYDEVRTTRRIRLHRRIGEVLEARYGDRFEPHLAELAHHFCEAASGGDIAKAIDYGQRAARRALAALAYEEAADLFERTLTAIEASDDVDELLHCELLLAHGDALFKAGAPEESDKTFREAIEIARRIDEPLHFAIGVIGIVHQIFGASRADEGLVTLIEEGLERISDDRPVLKGRLLLRHAGQLVWLRRLGEAREEAIRALDMIGDSEDLDARQEANAVHNVIVFGYQDAEHGCQAAEELVALSIAAGDRSAEFNARSGVIIYASALGDCDRVDAAMEANSLLAAELREPSFVSSAERYQAVRALREGRLEEARKIAWGAYQIGLRVDIPLATQLFQAQIFQQRRLQGRLSETVDALRIGVEAYRSALIWRTLLACAYAEGGDVGMAQKELDLFMQDRMAAIQENPVSGGTELYCLLSDAACICGDQDAANLLLERLEPFRDQQAHLTSAIPFGSVARVMGNLANLCEDFETAERHFERAIDLDTRFRVYSWIPRTQCDYARMLVARDGPGDRLRALSLLDEAITRSQEMGCKGWLDRCIETKLIAQGVDSGSTSPTGTIDTIASSIDSRRATLNLHTPSSDDHVTLMFSDMEGFTSMTERLGDYSAREVIREHNRIVREQLSRFMGEEVELQGDGFLLAFRRPDQALDCALALQHVLAERNSHASEPIRIRIGLHTGAALRDADRFFGRTVILAARIAAQAGGGEILVSEDHKAHLDERGDVAFGEALEVQLKGIADRQTLYRVRPCDSE